MMVILIILLNDNIAVRGGRSKGLKKLRDIKKLKDYGNMRNELSFENNYAICIH